MPPVSKINKKKSIQPSLLQQPHQQTQLQISQFIKDPVTLKLLILAGTNIKPTQFPTVSKCLNLIKLDLSSNSLTQIPLTFSHFSHLKILYLHDNNIYSIKIQNTIIEYLSLFNNQIKNYRQKIVEMNNKLIGLDYNVITKRQRAKKYNNKYNMNELEKYTMIKWPIVETNMTLESQEDYLNLLKAEIFVITNLYRKANHIQYIQNSLKSIIEYKNYRKIILNQSDQMKIKKYYVLQAVNTWKKYVIKNNKLRKFLQSRGKQSLLYNKLTLNKKNLSPNTLSCIQSFMSSLRSRMKARHVLLHHLLSYRLYIPISQKLTNIFYLSSSYMAPKLYFLKSQLHLLDKIFLFAKRLLFNKKFYDLCDNFDKIVAKQKKEYYIFRKNQRSYDKKSFLLNSIRESKNMVLKQKDVDRKHFLYTRKGHKQIGLKNRNKYKYKPQQMNKLKQKIKQNYSKVQKKYQSYDNLVLYSISNKILYDLLLKITRYFNSGNSQTILSNQTAYFQTQVIFKDDEQTKQMKKKQIIYVGLQFFVKRTIAANIIQKFWRRVSYKLKSNINIIKSIKISRACNMISHWIRNLTFNHRILLTKNLSYLRTLTPTFNQSYIQLDIYLSLSIPLNLLKIQKYQPLLFQSTQIFYKAIHTNTFIQIIELNNRKWVKIVFPSAKQVYYVQKLFMILTYRFYYNGFYIKLFNYNQVLQQNGKLEQYETKVKHLYGVEVKVNKGIDSNMILEQKFPKSKRLLIQNPNAYFIWAQIGDNHMQSKLNLQKKSLPISIFIYNKHQKPLKINCQFNYLTPSSIYHKKLPIISSKSSSFHSSNIRSRTPTKRFSMIQYSQPVSIISKLNNQSNNNSKISSSIITGDQIQKQYFFNKLRSKDKRDRRNSEITPHHTSLMQKNKDKNSRKISEKIQIDLLSKTLDIRKK